MLGNQLLNSTSGIEEDLNRLKGWTLCTPLVKPVRGGRRTTRVRARSPRRVGVAWRGEARPAGWVVRVRVRSIKIYRKLPSSLTIQKPDVVNRLSVSSFAATIKPPPFDGSNYKCWQERLILWLTVLSVMHVKEGKPK